mmetsp:Transcript_50366/g.151698  ORF Transcript_50366/g.151698 Transcript_50366/m.151698 type:complete len:564 (-) Transcript_50366:416-2107(-)
MEEVLPSAKDARIYDNAKALDPLNCSASELATFLLKRRFEDDAMGTASFLLECTASLPNAEEISAQLMGGGATAVEAEAIEDGESSDGNKDDDAEDALGPAVPLPWSKDGKEEDDGDVRRSSAEVSATVPRSKFELTAHEGGIVLTNKKGERLTIGTDVVEHVAIFPKPEDCRAPSVGAGRKKGGASPKRNGSMVLITLRESSEKGVAGVTFRSKALKQVCFQLPQYHAPPPGDLESDVEGEWAKLLQSSLRPESKVIRVANPAFGKGKGKKGAKNPDGSRAFRSDEGDVGTSVTTGGMPFVKCYRGVNDGVIYPLEQGLLFFKPPLFIHRSTLHSISCGRGSSSNGSRYVDLAAVLHGSDGDDDGGDEGGERMEFSNINREELRVLNYYIHKVLVRAMARDAADGSDDDDDEVVVEEVVAVNDDQDEDDGENDDTAGRRKRSRRAASREARAATKAQIASLEARKTAKAPQSGEDEQKDGSDDDDEEDAEEFRMDEHDSDSDEDGLADDVGVAMVDESDDEDAQIDDEDADSASETESESETDENDEKGDDKSRPKKMAKNG